MSEAQTTNERDAMNQVHLKKHAVLYGLVVVASLSLFGAGHTWASSSGWGACCCHRRGLGFCGGNGVVIYLS